MKSLTIDATVLTEFPSDPLINIIINAIKTGITDLTKLDNLSPLAPMKGTLKSERDWDTPKWKRLILTIDFKEPDFETKMEVWDCLDYLIRKHIYAAISVAPNSDKTQIHALNNALIIKFIL